MNLREEMHKLQRIIESNKAFRVIGMNLTEEARHEAISPFGSGLSDIYAGGDTTLKITINIDRRAILSHDERERKEMEVRMMEAQLDRVLLPEDQFHEEMMKAIPKRKREKGFVEMLSDL